jgi:hypothetical protein
MSIKTYEQLTFTAAFLSERLGSATVYYNGQSITSASGYGFDTREFDDCICSLNVGTVVGAIATLVNDVYECDTDDPSAATALSGGNFPDIVSTTDERLVHGSILCKDTKRFLFLRTETQGEPLTVDFGATWIGGTKRDTLLTPVSVQFDL